MYIYSITNGEYDNANEVLLAHEEKFSKNEFIEIYNDTVTKLKKKGKDVSVYAIANHLIKKEGFEQLPIHLGVWNKGFAFKKINKDHYDKRSRTFSR